MKKYLLIVSVAIALVSCGGKKVNSAVGEVLSATAQQDVVRPVEAAAAVSRSVPQDNVYSSTVEAYATNNIAPQAGGRIRKIYAEVGDYVPKGKLLAEMDRLQLDQTHLQMVNDSIELGRIRALYEQGGVAKSDLDAMELAFAVRKSTYANLKENTILRSPVTGYVTARNYDKGDLYTMAQPLFTVQQVVPVKLYVGISESEYTKVKVGDKVSLTADALPGRTFTGKITRLNPTINAMTHTFQAEVVVQNGDRALRPGMYARVTVNFGNRRSLIVPDQAVVKQEGTGQKFLYIVQQDSTVNYVPVTLGKHIGTEYEVLDGIDEGDLVVFKGQTALKHGSRVRVK